MIPEKIVELAGENERMRENERERNKDARHFVEMRCDSSYTFTYCIKARCNARVLAKMTEWPEKICARR